MTNTEYTQRLVEFWSKPTKLEAMVDRVCTQAPLEEWNDENQYRIWREIAGTLEQGKVVLDLGCGVGRLSKHALVDKHTVHAVDVAPVMLEYCKEHCDNNPRLITHLSDGFTVLRSRKPLPLVLRRLPAKRATEGSETAGSPLG